MSTIHIVAYEHRDMVGRIVVEVDSAYLDEDNAIARRKQINTDPEEYPGMVADNLDVPIRDWSLGHTSDSPNAHPKKLTKDDALAVKTRFAAKQSKAQIARELGISRTMVSRILSGEAWS